MALAPSKHQITNLPLMPTVLHTSRTGVPGAAKRLLRYTVLAPLRPPKPALLLKVVPALHRNLTRVEFAVAAVAGLVGALLLAGHLARVAPREVVKVPVRVRRQHEVPDR